MYVARGGLCLFIEKNKIHLINLAFVGMVFIVHKAHITGFFFFGVPKQRSEEAIVVVSIPPP